MNEYDIEDRFSPLERILNTTDPVMFARSVDFEPDDVWQKKFLRSTHHREMLIIHRQGGKSTTVGLKAYRLAKTGRGLGLIISPSERQSKELLLKIKMFAEKDKDKIKITSDTKTSMDFSNGSRIVALPANASTIRGYSAPNWVIVDEAALCPDDIYKGSILPMFSTSPSSKLYLISTPFGKRGFFWEEYKRENSIFRKTVVTADKCPRIKKEFLDEMRLSLGEKWFNQEFMCQFLNVNESTFTEELVDSIFLDDGKEIENEFEFSLVKTYQELFKCNFL